MKRVLEVQLNRDLACFQLSTEPTQSALIGFIRCANHQLLPKFFGDFLFLADQEVLGNLIVGLDRALKHLELFTRQFMHPDD